MNAQMLEVSIRSRNGAASSRKGGVVNGQTTKASNKFNTPPPPQVIRRCHPYARNYAQGAEVRLTKRFFAGMQLSPFMRLAANPMGASRLAQQMSAWSLTTRSAPPRHRRDARVYGHTPKATHDNEYSPPASSHSPPKTNHIAAFSEIT